MGVQLVFLGCVSASSFGEVEGGGKITLRKLLQFVSMCTCVNFWMWQCTVPNAVQPLPYLQVRTLLELHQELQSGHLGVEQSPLQADDSWALLAAPPNLKELVREEIRLLLIGLQQKASQEGRYWRLEEKGLERIKG